MRKMLLAIVLCVTIVSVVGCGSKKTDDNSNTTQTEVTTEATTQAEATTEAAVWTPSVKPGEVYIEGNTVKCMLGNGHTEFLSFLAHADLKNGDSYTYHERYGSESMKPFIEAVLKLSYSNYEFNAETRTITVKCDDKPSYEYPDMETVKVIKK